MDNENTVGNPQAEETQEAPQVDSNEFFDALDSDVQGGMFESMDEDEVPAQQEAVPNQTQPQQGTQQNDVNWKKRYDDSSAEALRMRGELNELKPYSALLDVMKKDQGLVSTVRDYLQNGGSAPKSVQDELKLDEDFEFDANEAVQNPNSESGQVFNKMMENQVNKRLNTVMAAEKQKNAMAQQQMVKQMEMKKFQEDKGLSDSDMTNFVQKAQSHTMTFEDAWNIVNKEQAQSNVAQSTKADMLHQMQNASKFPNTTAASNSVGVSENPNDAIFNMLKDSDGDIDNLFG